MASWNEVLVLTRVDPVTGIAEALAAGRRIDAIVAHPQAAKIVASLDPQTVFQLVREAGFEDAGELLDLVTVEQIQAFIDFDCWTRDELDVDRFSSWLEFLLQLDDERFEALDRVLDPELFVLWMRRHASVLQWQEDQDLLDQIDEPVFSSPCGVYALVVPAEDEVGNTMRLLLDRLYSLSILRGHRLLEATRWELETPMQEEAFRARTARMGDLGFLPWHEAVEVYSWLDPVDWLTRIRGIAAAGTARWVEFSDVGLLPPAALHMQELERLQGSESGSFLGRALATLPEVVPAEQLAWVRDAVLAQLRALINQVHVADGGHAGDLHAATVATMRVDAHVGIGLQLVARDDLMLGARVLATTPLRDIHRAGYSATARLARQAKQLVERGNLSLTEAATSLLDDETTDLFEGLLRPRPAMSGDGKTSFRTIEDVESVARTLGEVAFLELLFYGMMRHTKTELGALVYDRKRSVTPVELVGFRLLFTTRMLREVAGLSDDLEPLRLGELHGAQRALAAAPDAEAALVAAGQRIIERRRIAGTPVDALGRIWARRVARHWLDAVSPNASPLPAEVAGTLVLLRP